MCRSGAFESPPCSLKSHRLETLALREMDALLSLELLRRLRVLSKRVDFSMDVIMHNNALEHKHDCAPSCRGGKLSFGYD